MTAAAIIVEVKRISASPAPERPDAWYAKAVFTACDNLLSNPHLPGGSWVEQVILEAARILRETSP